MPIKFVVEDKGDYSVVVYRYFGSVTAEDIIDASQKAFRQLKPGTPYRSLLLFDRNTDLSELTQQSLDAVRARGNEEYRRFRLGPRIGAAVLDHSSDARMLLPLFNALNLARGGVDLSFAPFETLEPALERLGIPLDEGRALVARAMSDPDF